MTSLDSSSSLSSSRSAAVKDLFATSIASLKDNSANVCAGVEVATGEATAGPENANLTLAGDAAAGGFATDGGAQPKAGWPRVKASVHLVWERS